MLFVNKILLFRGDNCFQLTTCPEIFNSKSNLTHKIDQHESKYKCILINNQNELVSFSCLHYFLNLFVAPFMFKYYYETIQ